MTKDDGLAISEIYAPLTVLPLLDEIHNELSKLDDDEVAVASRILPT